MLTIKHVTSAGRQRIISCDEVIHDGDSPSVTVIVRAKEMLLVMDAGDKLYIENDAGKTTDVIRVK